MKYLSSYYWQQEEPAETSLVLQHFVYRKGKLPGLFACICTGSAYFTEQLTYWFQTEGRELLRLDSSPDLDKTKAKIQQIISRIDSDLAEFASCKKIEACKNTHFIGMLSIGKRFLIFSRGELRAYLLNRRFERVHCKCLTPQKENEELQIMSGDMETGIGLLLSTRSFAQNLEREQIKTCLSVKELTRTENVKGRLRELGEEAARQGGRHMGAILLLTCGGKEYGV